MLKKLLYLSLSHITNSSLTLEHCWKLYKSLKIAFPRRSLFGIQQHSSRLWLGFSFFAMKRQLLNKFTVSCFSIQCIQYWILLGVVKYNIVHFPNKSLKKNLIEAAWPRLLDPKGFTVYQLRSSYRKLGIHPNVNFILWHWVFIFLQAESLQKKFILL